MMLQESRASSSNQDPLKSTRGSIFSRALGRDSRPAWSNRIVKDFNDLDYDTSINRFSNPNRFKNTHLQQKQRLKADLIKRKSKSKKKVNPQDEYYPPSKRPKSSKKSIKMSQSMHRPERIQINTLDAVSTKHSGLSPFEYSNTIQGRIQRRSSHHLSYQKNKIQRMLNQNKIYYDRNQDIDLSNSLILTNRKQLKKYHPFESYLDRKVFQPRDQLDKFFDIDSASRVISPRRIRAAVRGFQGVIQRKDPRLNESAGLAYEIGGSIQLIKKRSQKYSIPKTTRQIILGNEVINPEKGCRR